MTIDVYNPVNPLSLAWVGVAVIGVIVNLVELWDLHGWQRAARTADLSAGALALLHLRVRTQWLRLSLTLVALAIGVPSLFLPRGPIIRHPLPVTIYTGAVVIGLVFVQLETIVVTILDRIYTQQHLRPRRRERRERRVH